VDMTSVYTREDLLSLLDQSVRSIALLKITVNHTFEYEGTIQFIENGLLNKIIIESIDMKRYTKIDLMHITQIKSDIKLRLQDETSHFFDIVLPVHAHN
jgi:hypothetical protein